MPTILCVECGTAFHVIPARVKTAKYCGRKCVNIATGRRSKGNEYRKGLRPSNAFENGSIPWNKNIKGIHLSPETEFKRGIVPINKVTVGTISQRNDHNLSLRNFIKIAESDIWILYSRYLWEQAHGEIPEGYIIHHINRDPLDDRLENYEMLTKSEHIERHRAEYLEIKRQRNIMKKKKLHMELEG